VVVGACAPGGWLESELFFQLVNQVVHLILVVVDSVINVFRVHHVSASVGILTGCPEFAVSKQLVGFGSAGPFCDRLGSWHVVSCCVLVGVCRC